MEVTLTEMLAVEVCGACYGQCPCAYCGNGMTNGGYLSAKERETLDACRACWNCGMQNIENNFCVSCGANQN